MFGSPGSAEVAPFVDIHDSQVFPVGKKNLGRVACAVTLKLCDTLKDWH